MPGNGTVFAINTDGAGFRVLHTFTGTSVKKHERRWKRPRASLLSSGDALYGTTVFGGLLGKGMVFSLHTDGTSFTNLHSFIGPGDGSGPQAAWVFVILAFLGKFSNGVVLLILGFVMAVMGTFSGILSFSKCKTKGLAWFVTGLNGCLVGFFSIERRMAHFEAT